MAQHAPGSNSTTFWLHNNTALVDSFKSRDLKEIEASAWSMSGCTDSETFQIQLFLFFIVFIFIERFGSGVCFSLHVFIVKCGRCVTDELLCQFKFQAGAFG